MNNLKLFTWLTFLISSGFVQAETTAENMQISTEVTATCLITADNVSFPPFTPRVDPSRVEATNDGYLTPSCTKGTAYSLSMNLGLNGVTGSNIGYMNHIDSSDVKLKYYISVSGIDGYSRIPKANENFVSWTGGGMDVPHAMRFQAFIRRTDEGDPLKTYTRGIEGSYVDTVTLTVTY